MPKEDILVDAVITAGELDQSGHQFLDNDLKVFEIAKHNIPYSEFLSWMTSTERWKRTMELEHIGQERFGTDYWKKYKVCCYCTSPHKD